MFGLSTAKIIDCKHPFGRSSFLNHKVFFVSFLAFMATILSSSYVLAVSADMSKTYLASQDIGSGQIVALSGENAERVVVAKRNDTQRVLGVVVSANDSTLEFRDRDNNDDHMVNVALAGRAMVLLGPNSEDINRGDLIGISDGQDGIGEKAKPGYQTVGVAEVSASSLDNEGDYKKMPIIVTPGVAEAAITQDNVFARVVGKDVSVLQMVFATLIAFFGLVAIGFLSYSSVRHSVVAVGRNPLARPAILGAMIQVMVMVSLISIVSIGLMYVTLKA